MRAVHAVCVRRYTAGITGARWFICASLGTVVWGYLIGLKINVRSTQSMPGLVADDSQYCGIALTESQAASLVFGDNHHGNSSRFRVAESAAASLNCSRKVPAWYLLAVLDGLRFAFA